MAVTLILFTIWHVLKWRGFLKNCKNLLWKVLRNTLEKISSRYFVTGKWVLFLFLAERPFPNWVKWWGEKLRLLSAKKLRPQAIKLSYKIWCCCSGKGGLYSFHLHTWGKMRHNRNVNLRVKLFFNIVKFSSRAGWEFTKLLRQIKVLRKITPWLESRLLC